MDNTLQNAYKIVYDDIVNSGVGLFTGNFDSKNGIIDKLQFIITKHHSHERNRI